MFTNIARPSRRNFSIKRPTPTHQHIQLAPPELSLLVYGPSRFFKKQSEENIQNTLKYLINTAHPTFSRSKYFS